MKFLETHFEEYINSVNKINLHPKLEKFIINFQIPSIIWVILYIMAQEELENIVKCYIL